MSAVTAVIDKIKLAALEAGGINRLAAGTSVPVDTARRLVNGSPKMLRNLRELEAAADSVLAKRQP